MKIFFVIKSLNTAGGMERMTVTIANELTKRGYETGIISISSGKSFFETLPDVKLFFLEEKNDKSFFLTKDSNRKKKLKNIYSIEKPDVVIFVGSGRSMLNIPAAKGIKTITWEHFNANVNWHLLHPLSKKMAAKNCDRIVTLTHQDVKNYQKKYGAKNAVCIPNPITIENLERSPLTEKRVLTVGRLMPQKGFDLLLEAWNKTKNRHNGWKLRIVGKGKFEKQLKDIIIKHQLQDSVEMITFSDNIREHYAASSIYAMSSRFEGLPLVLIEAMSAGLPIVSFDCETGPADIILNQKSGILVPPLDVEKLAFELDNLMNDKEKREFFSTNAIEHSKNFTVEKVMQQWENLLQELR